MADAFIDFLLDDLTQILNHNTNSFFIAVDTDIIKSLCEDLIRIRSSLTHLEEKSNDLVVRIKNLVCPVLEELDAFVGEILVKSNQNKYGRIHCLFDRRPRLKIPRHFAEEIESIKKMAVEITQVKSDSTEKPEEDGTLFTARVSGGGVSGFQENETIVGFNEELEILKGRLTSDQKKLQAISIVGMAGIGKTTMAKRLYNDPSILHHFYARAWTYVSQVYRRKDLFLRILSCIVKDKDKLSEISEEKLGGELYRCLKRKRYLIVVDDIWNVEAWEDVRKSFPDDGNGSRILLTTRLKDVGLEISPKKHLYFMPFLSEDESWALLREKAFQGKRCPGKLEEVGQKIAAKCQGLPLAIVVVGGFLAKKEKTERLWNEVAQNLSSYMGKEEQFKDILALSYEHLPFHLQSCFLYFGAFPEDYEIPAWRLISLWIAEGLVQETRDKNSVDVAEDYLKDLTDRSLVLVTKKRLRGGIKACCLHDMLRDLCLSKAKEKNLLQHVASPSTPVSFSYPCFHSHGFHKITERPCSPNLYSRFWYASEDGNPPPQPTTFTFIYKFLKVLNLWCIYLENFPLEILYLFHLRYLEIRVQYLDRISPFLSNLHNLETLIIDKGEWGRVTMPYSIWKMVKLRHIGISEETEFEMPNQNYGYLSKLVELKKLSAILLSRSSKHAEDVLSRTPNLRKLTFYRSPFKKGPFSLPDLAKLSQLESLKLSENSWQPTMSRIPDPSKFPQSLKKLNLSGGHLDWMEVSKLGKLSNLEVLKLRRNFFSGPRWETNEGEFYRLKVLKLSWMDLKKWVTYSSHFPCLECLLLERCENLEEIPCDLGNIPTLQMITVHWSGRSPAKSARMIQKEQQNLGNDLLKIYTYPLLEKDSEEVDELDCKMM